MAKDKSYSASELDELLSTPIENGNFAQLMTTPVNLSASTASSVNADELVAQMLNIRSELDSMKEISEARAKQFQLLQEDLSIPKSFLVRDNNKINDYEGCVIKNDGCIEFTNEPATYRPLYDRAKDKLYIMDSLGRVIYVCEYSQRDMKWYVDTDSTDPLLNLNRRFDWKLWDRNYDKAFRNLVELLSEAISESNPEKMESEFTEFFKKKAHML